MTEAMDAEFDTVAEWTAQVARDLGPDYFVPAGCRGSGNPAALDWLVDRMQLRPGETLLDSGAGVGGPAGYAASRVPVAPVLVEPQAGACRAARSMFDFPAIQAVADALPFSDNAFDSAWCLGVLCTTEAQQQVLDELRRVVRAPGRIGLLVFLATAELTDDQQPDGNNFPTETSLQQMLDRAGLVVDERIDTSDLPPIPQDWQDRVAAVDDALQRRFGDRDAWQIAERQSGRMGELLGDGRVSGVVLSLRRKV